MFGEPKADEAFVETQLVDGVLTLRMGDAASRNGLSGAMVSALMAGFLRANEEDVLAVVLCGLPEVFCSGATKEILDSLRDSKIAPDELGLGKRVLQCPVPVIAACRGWAVGGGFALALSCDFVVLADERRYGFNFIDLGITPGMGSTVLAERFLAKSIAQELLFSGELRRGRAFAHTGINYVTPADVVEQRAADLAFRIAEKPRTSITLLKQHFAAQRLVRLEQALAGEVEMHRETLKNLDLSNFGSS